MAVFASPAEAIAWLRSPAAIRERCGLILAAAERDQLAHLGLEPARLDPAADYVVDTIRATYPDLSIPYHSRWRHFAVGGRDVWSELAAQLGDVARAERARIRFDLVITSVLLDAGAGEAWRYREPATGAVLARSEGLALASFDLFAAGALSARPEQPLRADASALAGLERATLAEVFQVRADNPLLGVDGRVGLLQALGRTLYCRPDLFGASQPRLGRLFDHLAGQAADGRLAAPIVLAAVLDAFAPIWPDRIALAGVNLGDVGRHPAARSADLTDGLVPFHKLSQWLTYSLLEPLEEAGIVVTELDRLTALAEYRNGGLLVDLGVLRPKRAAVLGQAHAGGSEVVVEWRALTIALLDRLAERIRAKLGHTAAELPLAKVLEGGTWSAGRRIAAELRPGGPPPLRVISDGTLF